MLCVGLVPKTHLTLFRELVQFLLIQQNEDLVGRSVGSESVSFLLQGPANPLGGGNGSTTDFTVKIVSKQRVELDTGYKTLCENSSVLLDYREETGYGIVLWKNQRFTEKSTALGSSNIEYVAQAGQIGHGDVVFRTGKGIGQTSSVHIEAETLVAAYTADVLKFPKSIERAELCRIGEIDCTGLHHMVPIPVALPGVPAGKNVGGIEFPVSSLDGEDLVSSALNGARFVDADMTGFDRNDPFVWPQNRIQNNGVGLCSADQEPHVRFRCFASLADPGFGGLGKSVFSIYTGFDEIVFQHLLQNRGMRTLIIITGEIQLVGHICIPLYFRMMLS